ncbi:MAG TPA: sigma-54 dependent transcriptional regulator [Polyangiaceae bacterium]|nr:sigma-54 dependent transcriptional regulator [Polyangiaceae bacterium]
MKILIVDDQRSARRVLRDMLASLPELELLEAADRVQAVEIVERQQPDLILLDIRLSADTRDRGGLELLRQVRASGIAVPTIVVTSAGELAEVREAMRAGAQDYVFKDELCPELLVPIVEGFRERLRLADEIVRLREKVDSTFGPDAILGESPAIDRVRKLVRRVASADATVLIRGETGVGKEMVARAIHQTSSRRDAPFIAVNCSALPGTLVESLLFGHEKGAFTGADRRVRGQLELAGGGTILLDEIAEMGPELQAKLLRVLEDRKYRPLGSEAELPLRARVLAATHAPLEARVAEKRFREDLFYRLNVVAIDVPPLRDRRSDIPLLVSAVASQFSRKLRFSDEAMAWLERRPWPGNVRELRNVVERIALLADEDTIGVPALVEIVGDGPRGDVGGDIDRIARSLIALPDGRGSKLRLVERAVLQHAVDVCGGNKSAAARLIGIERKQLERRWERMSAERVEEEEED